MTTNLESGSASEGAPVEPLFRVVRGTPTDVELAALSVVLAARSRPVDEPAPPRQGPTAWAAAARGGRQPGRPGPDAWRRSRG